MNRYFRWRRMWRGLALLLCFSPLSAAGQQLNGVTASEWLALGRNENFHAYLDQRSVQRNGDLARVYQLTDFTSAQWVDERTVIGSIKALVEYDCARSRSRTLVFEAYSEQMGEGRLVASEQKPDAEWENIAPGGTVENVWRMVCGK
jgi:hypothetical protein